MGLGNESKAVTTPGVRTTDEEDGKELGAEDRACYRSWTVRGCLSQDRCELQFAAKELARRMQQPKARRELTIVKVPGVENPGMLEASRVGGRSRMAFRVAQGT